MTQPPCTLSICIPTYNRAFFLRETLKTIVRQPAFAQTQDIEIVISDNCSDDDTPAVVAEFAAAFPGKIRYYRQPEPIPADMNFTAVLAQARGSYLKLHNDDLIIGNGALGEMLKVIQTMSDERPIIFFTNGQRGGGQQIEAASNLNEFVRRASFMATWIGGFGIWREDFLALPDISRNAHLRLIQTDILFRLLSQGKRAIIVYDNYFFRLHLDKKDSYNVAEVFGKNYIELLKFYLQAGALDEAVFREEKRTVFLEHTFALYFNSDSGFEKTGFFIHMQEYLHEDYFQEALEKMLFMGFDAGRKLKRAALAEKAQSDATPPPA